jgi:putative salt-induced outer membrane protein YdiY
MLFRSTVALTCLAITGAALADTLVLHNGDRLTGSVQRIDGGVVYFSNELTGDLEVAVDTVAHLTTDGQLTFSTGSGEMVTGQLQLANGQQMMLTEYGLTSVDLAAIEMPEPDSDEAAKREWHSTVDVSASFAVGNTETENYRGNAEALLKGPHSEHSLLFNAQYEEADDEVKRNQLRANYDYRWYYYEDMYAVGNSEYFQDKVADVDMRVTLGGGLGRRFWDEPTGRLTVELSAAATYEELSGVSETNPALRWALDYNRRFRENALEFFHRNRALKIFDDDRGEIYSATTGFRYALSSRWTTSFVMELQHETKPQPGRKRTDIVYTLGMGVRF